MAFDFYPITNGRRVLGSFVLRPSLGVMVWAMGYSRSLRSTMAYTAYNGLADAMLGYFEMGFTPAIDNVPALAKYEDPPKQYVSDSRLVASMHLANERLETEAKGRGLAEGDAGCSLAALYVQGARASLVHAGPSIDAWLVRGGEIEPLVPRTPENTTTDLTPAVLDIPLENGDWIGIGMLVEEVMRAACRRPSAPAVVQQMLRATEDNFIHGVLGHYHTS